MLNDQTKKILSFRGFAELQRRKQEQRQALKDSSISRKLANTITWRWGRSPVAAGGGKLGGVAKAL